jgi:uncharacterized protein YprB with RNaseH-like and TPR domain
MLSWAIKEKGGDTYYDVITKSDIFDRNIRDRRIVISLLEELKKYSVVCTYYGTNFDLPFLRAKALHYGLEGLEYGTAFHLDLYFTIKSKFALSRKSLAVATEYFGIPGKTPLDHNIWYNAQYGEPEELKMVLEHNIADVEITEKLHDKIVPYRKWLRNSV